MREFGLQGSVCLYSNPLRCRLSARLKPTDNAWQVGSVIGGFLRSTAAVRPSSGLKIPDTLQRGSERSQFPSPAFKISLHSSRSGQHSSIFGYGLRPSSLRMHSNKTASSGSYLKVGPVVVGSQLRMAGYIVCPTTARSRLLYLSLGN